VCSTRIHIQPGLDGWMHLKFKYTNANSKVKTFRPKSNSAVDSFGTESIPSARNSQHLDNRRIWTIKLTVAE
jgi:hypothetical protein